MATLELNFLGRTEIRLDGQPVTGFESDKARLVLAYLAIESGQPHRRESLAGLFWPESPEKRARQSLSQVLYNLRQLLCQDGNTECLEVTAKDVCLYQGQGVTVDVSRFLTLLREIDGHVHPAAWACRSCQERLAEAANLDRGELLAGFSLPSAESFEAWLFDQREYLQGKVLMVLAELVHSHLKRGNLTEALGYVERLVALDRLNEANQRQWLTILGLMGSRTKALEQYAVLQRLLADELGVEPEAETVSLVDKISHGFEQFTIASQLPQKLPAALTTFVGRDEELQDLYWKLLDPGCRLLTILGMGGSGKTRLALEAARSLLPAFPGGVFLVELGVLASPHDLLPAITRTLEVRLKSFQEMAKTVGLAQQLFDFLRGKELLLILDSAEMVLEGAKAVSDILQNAPGVKVLATSRSRLDLAGEHLMQLGGLPFPADASPGWEESPAVQLFEVAGQRSNPGFILTAENASAVIQICRKLQGMPLAILLATAWVSAMPPDKILKEIQVTLDFLAVGWQDMPARQKSLRAAFDYSWGLLWPEEKSVLRKLSIFSQPFTDELAREIAQATAHHLKALLDFSLIQRTGLDRLRLHDLVRQYALDRLIEEPQESLALQHRFANLYKQKLEKWGLEIKSSEQVRVMGEMDLEIENARLAWDWLSGQEPDDRLAEALEGLGTYYDRRGQYQRGESACEFTLSQVEKMGIDRGKVRLWARLAAWQGHFWIALGRTDDGLKRLEKTGQELDQEKWQDLDSGFERALVLFFTLLAKVRIDNPTALDCATRSAELFRQCGERWYTARALVYAGAALESLGRYDEQLVVSQQALEIQSPGGDPELIRYIRYVLGCGYIYKGDVGRGSQIIEESLQSASNSEMKDEIARNTISLAVNQIFMGDFQKALPYLELAFSIYQEMGKPFGDENYIRYLAITWGLGNYDQAIDLCSKITGVYGQSLTFFDGSIYLLQGKIDLAQAAFERSLQAALETTNNRAVGMILALLSMARYKAGQMEGAADLLRQALEKSRSGNTLEMSVSLLAVVFYLMEGGKVEQALEVYAAAIQVPLFGKSAWTHDFLGVRLEQLAKTLPDEVVEAARARGRAHQLPALVGQWADQLPVLPPDLTGL